MPTSQNTPIQTNVSFGRIAVTVPVTDMGRALRFYTEVLGMTNVFENGNPVGFVILKRDAGEIHLTLSNSHIATDRNIAHMMVNDAKGLYDRLVSQETRIIKGIKDADYGIRGFVFADPDGNRIDVGQQL